MAKNYADPQTKEEQEKSEVKDFKISITMDYKAETKVIQIPRKAKSANDVKRRVMNQLNSNGSGEHIALATRSGYKIIHRMKVGNVKIEQVKE